ncbi:hypothetical protein LTS14_009416 [Recurvomyces mirabilis]|uniref:uncharacterized protein n=1 Tax=Recurvomyces mirabilis TaxID=574656 RepID=UPI002DDF10C3|nr:hypothetical protein LTS14_009416 [Recurvomyces mirabilis]
MLARSKEWSRYVQCDTAVCTSDVEEVVERVATMNATARKSRSGWRMDEGERAGCGSQREKWEMPSSLPLVVTARNARMLQLDSWVYGFMYMPCSENDDEIVDTACHRQLSDSTLAVGRRTLVYTRLTVIRGQQVLDRNRLPIPVLIDSMALRRASSVAGAYPYSTRGGHMHEQLPQR